MTSQPKVLSLAPKIFYAHDAWSSLSKDLDIIAPKATNREEFIAECKSGAFDGVAVIYRDFFSPKITGYLDDEILCALPDSLRFICSFGAGYEQVDVEACTAHNVLVSNTPTVVDDATADTAIFLMLGTLRNFTPGIFSAKKGQWIGSGPFPDGHDPKGKTLGILGMGGIGRSLAAKARVFGMRIRYHNRTRLPEELEAGAEYVSFETLLAESDVLSLNIPLNASTHHLISAPQLSLMKPGITIINTARGAIIDEPALVDALNSGHVSSVGLDVFENEPQVHPGLLSHPRAFLLPHLGTNSVETLTAMEEWAMDNVRLACEHGRMKNVVPEQRFLVERLN